MNIAVAGKGGTGKTTFTALLIDQMIENDKRPILAVDADANANLNEALGMEIRAKITDVLNDFKDSEDEIPPGMDKINYMELQLNSALSEDEDVDLLVMGGPVGPGCFCYPNDLLKKFMNRLDDNYPHVVMDNEAGLEHLTRRTTQDIDILFVISDSSARGIRSAGRIKEIVDSDKLDLRVDETYLVVTKATDEMMDTLAGEIEKTGLEVIGTIPHDSQITEYDLHGKPLVDLPDDSAALEAVEEIAEKTVLAD